LAEKIGDDYYYDDYYSKESNERRKERILSDKYWNYTFGHFIEYKSQRQYSDWLWFVYQGMLKNKVDGLIFLEQTHWYIEVSKADEKKYEKGLLKLDPKVWRKKPKVFAALDSNQIKLADGTNTTFDPTNPDIRFKKGGSTDILLAPNGKPSNLTPEQYKLVRTSAFKSWFGDWEKLAMTKLYDAGIDEVSLKRLSDEVSKIVDENGEPKPVYHGSPSTFTIFNEHINAGYFFAETKQRATIFGNRFASRKGITYEVFLNVRKLFDPKKMTNVEKAKIKQMVEYVDDVSELFVDRNFHPVKEKNIFRYLEDSDFVLKLLENYSDSWLLIESIPFQSWLKKERYDGYKVQEEGITNYAVYQNKNIKLADGTNTTFDAGSTDIRFGGGGITYKSNKCVLPKINIAQINTDEFKKWWNTGELNEQELPTIQDVKYRGQRNNIGYVFNYGEKLLPKGAGIDNGQDFAFYFVDEEDIDVAKYYAYCDTSESKGHLMAVWLRLHFPLEIFKRFMSGKEFIELLKENEIDPIKEIPNDNKQESIFSLLENYEPKKLRENIQKAGFDGIIFNDGNSEMGEFMSYVVFNPNQIKSATENIGTFDNDNFDIRFEKGGYLEQIANDPALEYSKGGRLKHTDLTKIPNFNNVYKGAEVAEYSEDPEKVKSAERWWELFRKNQKEQILTDDEYGEFMKLSNELAWENI
jgi:hypothetical protein